MIHHIVFCTLFLSLSLVSVTSDPSYQLLVGDTPTMFASSEEYGDAAIELNTTLSFTDKLISFSFWMSYQNSPFPISSTDPMSVLNYQIGNTSAGQLINMVPNTTDNTYELNINGTDGTSTTETLTNDDTSTRWIFVYVGYDIQNSTIYTMTSSSIPNIVFSSVYSGVDFSTLTAIQVNSTLAWASFRCYNYLINDDYIWYTGDELTRIIWLKFNPLEATSDYKRIKDYAMNNTVFRGLSYTANDTYDSSIYTTSDVSGGNSQRNEFSTATEYTTAYADYLDDDFTFTAWVNIEQAGNYTLFNITSTVRDDNTSFALNMTSSGSNNAMSFGIMLTYANLTQLPSSPPSSAVSFSVDATKWMFIKVQNLQLETTTLTQVMLYDSSGVLQLADLINTPGLVSFVYPKILLGGFIGALKDVMFFSGTISGLLPTPNCDLSYGAVYLNGTVLTNTSICALCSNSYILDQDTQLCIPSTSCSDVDGDANVCRTTYSAQIDVLTNCDSTCSSCFASSQDSCLKCSGTLFKDNYDDSCMATCPDDFTGVVDSTVSPTNRTCVSLEQVSLNATIATQTNTSLLVTFNQPVQNVSLVEAFTTGSILIEIIGVGIGPTNYTCKPSSLYTTTSAATISSFFVNCSYTVPMPKRIVEVTFNDTSLIQTANAIPISNSSAAVSTTMTAYFILTNSQNDTMNKMDTAFEALLICLAVFAALFAITDNMWVIWSLFDSFQLMNYFLYFNYDFPENTRHFLDELGIFNFKFIPSILDAIKTDPIVNQDPYPYLVDRGYSSFSFLQNAGSYIILYVVMALAFTIAYSLTLIHFRRDRIRDQIAYAYRLIKIILLRIFLLTYLDLTMACFLQLKAYDFSNTFNILSFAAAVIFTSIIVIMPFGIMWNIHVSHKTGYMREDNQYSAVLDLLVEFDQESVIARNFPFFLLFRKAFIVPVLIFLYDYPVLQIGLVINLTLNVLLWILVQKIYRNLKFAIINLVVEVAILTICGIIFCLQVLNQFQDADLAVSDALYYGWVIASLILAIEGVYVLFGTLLLLYHLGAWIHHWKFAEKKKEGQTYNSTEGEASPARRANKGDLELSRVDLNSTQSPLNRANSANGNRFDAADFSLKIRPAGDSPTGEYEML